MDINDIMPPEWLAWHYTIENFDRRILAIYAKARELFPDLWVNVRDGVRVNHWCGLRSPTCNVGAPKSAHRSGKALELHSGRLDALREWCTSAGGLKVGILRVEAAVATPMWVHVDVVEPKPERWTDKTRPYAFLP
jgi:hypothetical protein